MPERTYRDVEVDLDDLADAVIDWFEHDGFEVQDFQEGPAIFIQARKQSLLSTLSATTQALNVRLAPLTAGFKVQVGAGEWLDKGVGALATGLALKFLNPFVALGAGVATGFGIYQQLKLPDLLLDFVEVYVDRHGAPLAEREAPARRPRRGREVEAELEELRREPAASADPASPTSPASGPFCRQCGKALRADDRFCAGCGAKVEAPDAAAGEAGPDQA